MSSALDFTRLSFSLFVFLLIFISLLSVLVVEIAKIEVVEIFANIMFGIALLLAFAVISRKLT